MWRNGEPACNTVDGVDARTLSEFPAVPISFELGDIQYPYNGIIALQFADPAHIPAYNMSGDPFPDNTNCCKFEYNCPVEKVYQWNPLTSQLEHTGEVGSHPIYTSIGVPPTTAGQNWGCNPDGVTRDVGIPTFGAPNPVSYPITNLNEIDTQCCVFKHTCHYENAENSVYGLPTEDYDNSSFIGCGLDLCPEEPEDTNYNTGDGCVNQSNVVMPEVGIPLGITYPWAGMLGSDTSNYGYSIPTTGSQHCCDWGCDNDENYPDVDFHPSIVDTDYPMENFNDVLIINQ